MKKSICIILCLMLLLTGCGQQTKLPALVKEYWNASVADTFAAFGVSERETTAQNKSEGKSGTHQTYEFSNVKIDGVRCDLLIEFKGYPDCEPGLCSMTFCFSEKRAKKAEKLYAKLTADTDYFEINGHGGYFTAALVADQTEWLVQYANLYLGENGYYPGNSRIQNGQVARMPTPPSPYEESPLVKMQFQRGENGCQIYLSSEIFCILGQKSGLETLYPSGMPVYAEE